MLGGASHVWAEVNRIPSGRWQKRGRWSPNGSQSPKTSFDGFSLWGDRYLGTWWNLTHSHFSSFFGSESFTVGHWMMRDLWIFFSWGCSELHLEHISHGGWSVGISQGPSSLNKDVPICYFFQVRVETTKDPYSWLHPHVQSGAVFCSTQKRSLQS